MRVQRLRISQVLGIDELEIEPGNVTVAEGRNGAGKSSLIEALRSVVQGGHDATLVRHGADAGEVVLLLDDGTEIRKRITQAGSTLSVKDAEGKQVRAPQGYVNRLADALSFDPAAFLRADDKRRAELFLEALPLELDRPALLAAVHGLIDVPESSLRGHPFDVLGAIHKRVYDERTGINRAGKEKRATVEQLSQSLPEEAGAADESAPLEARKKELVDQWETSVRGVEQERDASLEALREETQRRIDEIRIEAEQEAEKIRHGAAEQVAALNEEAGPAIEEVTAAIAAAREREKAAVAAENTRQVVAKMKAEVEALAEQSRALTAALGRLDALKLDLAKQIPMKGVEVRDGQIYKDDIPWPRMNRAEQVKLAIRLAQLRAGDLRLVCVDELECLDDRTFEAFRRNAAKTDLQFVVTRVSDEAPGLRISSEPAALAGAAS